MGMCPNCHEELFILTTQAEDFDDEVSADFLQKAEDQRRQLKETSQK